MSYQNVFAKQFDTALWRALRAGVQGAFVEGLSYGLTNAMIYLSEGELRRSYSPFGGHSFAL